MNLPQDHRVASRPPEGRRSRRLNPGWVFLLLVSCGTSVADDGFWSHAGGGSWAATSNWDEGVIADGADNTAYFGLALYADIPASATFTLDGARTIGNVVFTDPNGPDNWALNTGSGGPLTLDYSFDTPSITVGLASQTVTIGAALAGSLGMEKLGPGTLILAATNQYSGETIVSEGTLLLNGQIGADGVDVVSGTLGGTGVISGTLTIESGATLVPGNSLGTLYVSNTVTLLSGSKTQIEINAATLNHAAVYGLTGASYGGTLVVSNLAGMPAPGQAYQIFGPANATGNFSAITPSLGGSLQWRFNPASGILSVISPVSQPGIATISAVGTNLILHVTNGPPGDTAYTLATTNAIQALAAWPRVATNQFDANGALNVTNAMTPGVGQQFYRIAVAPSP
jgi:autotransporter-associated beta strand protein